MKETIERVVKLSKFINTERKNFHSTKITKKEDIEEMINYLLYLEKELSNFSREIREEGITIDKANGFIRKSRFELVDILEQSHEKEAITKTKEVFILIEEYLKKLRERLDEKVIIWNTEYETTFDEKKIKKS